jgi:hypothetical protein
VNRLSFKHRGLHTTDAERNHNIRIPGFASDMTSISRGEQELVCRTAVAEPGSQTPGVAVNGVALHSPHVKLSYQTTMAQQSQEDFK